MIADQTHSISRDYGVLCEPQGVAFRGLFLIDDKGAIRHMLINDLPLGRSVDEALRMVDALKFFEENGEVCPANWHPGDKTIQADPDKSKRFFKDSEPIFLRRIEVTRNRVEHDGLLKRVFARYQLQDRESLLRFVLVES